MKRYNIDFDTVKQNNKQKTIRTIENATFTDWLIQCCRNLQSVQIQGIFTVQNDKVYKSGALQGGRGDD